jgi:iron complex outermembrane recepter protein
MRAKNAIVLSSISLTALVASPAFAQAAAPVETTPQKTQESEQPRSTTSPTNAQGQPAATTPPTESGAAIVITGSRIRRNNFTTPQNIDILTRDDQILSGTRTTAETLQSATITSGTSQISGSFLGFLSEGGQAANTVGLRGLGSSRTLVLLNGRRLAPAGVGPQLVSADLNVLPTAIVQRIEVLREGASSIYGSDAIAGVINIITDTSIDGITIDGFADHPLYGNGDTLRGSITAGKTFSRGHITGSFEYSNQEGLRLGDRKDTSCPRELAYINGQEIGQGSPLDPNQLRCFPFQRGGGGIANGYGLYGYYFGAPYNNVFATGRATFPGYATGTPFLGPPVIVNSYFKRPLASPTQLRQTVISPIEKFTGYLNGAYELDALGDAELYGEALFSRRKSHQDNAVQLNFQRIDKTKAALTYGGYYYDGTPLTSLGFPATPFFPVAWANLGINYFGPFIVPQETARAQQKVDFFRGNAGLRGNLGFGDWRYDGNVQISRTRGTDQIQNPLTSRLTASLNPVIAPSGTPTDLTVVGLPGQVGAGNTYTCATNVTNGAYNGGSCVPINFFDPSIVLNGQLSQALFNYLYPMLTLSKTKYDQETLSFNVDGTLFRLQGGDVKGAAGFEHRHDFIDDQPGPERAAGDIYGFSTIGETKGSDIVNEAFAEVDAPIFKDLPWANLLEIDASGRFTHYRSYGSGFTYHLSGQWAPVSEIRFRGNYGTNFRAPNLYEQFLNNELGFYPGGFDPCNDFGINLAPGSTVYNNCLAALTPILGANATNFFTSGSIPVYTTGGANNHLKAEHAKTWGFGAVFTMPRRIADFSLAVDYWNVDVKDEVSNLGNLILNFCYQATDFPNNPYCALIGPRLPAGDIHAGEISSFQNPYLNIAQQQASGIDFDVRYSAPVFGGRFSTQLQATRNLHQKLEQFAGQGLIDYNGTLGYPGQGAGPKWVGTLDTRFKTANNITFRWGVKYVGPADSQKFDPGTFVGGQKVTYDLRAEAYWEHGLSVQWLWPNVGQVTLGMNNIFNEKPPTISDNNTGIPRLGNFFANGPYDYYGRSIFVNVTRTFKPF